MKKFVPAAVGMALLLISSNVFAQIKMSAGISAGESYFNVGRSSLGDFNYNPGLNIGGVFDVDFSNIVALELAPEFTMRGYTFQNAGASDTSLFGGGAASFSSYLGYITLSLRSKIKYPVFPSCNVYALTGPNIGFLVSGKLDSTVSGLLKAGAKPGDTTAYRHSTSTDVRNNFNTVDLGWDFGAGVEYHLAMFTPFIEAAYYLDILDINKNFWVNDNYIAYHNYGYEVKVGVRVAIN